eukprot:ANDGO_04032.mRNA.1 hypothetical protein
MNQSWKAILDVFQRLSSPELRIGDQTCDCVVQECVSRLKQSLEILDLSVDPSFLSSIPDRISRIFGKKLGIPPFLAPENFFFASFSMLLRFKEDEAFPDVTDEFIYHVISRGYGECLLLFMSKCLSDKPQTLQMFVASACRHPNAPTLLIQLFTCNRYLQSTTWQVLMTAFISQGPDLCLDTFCLSTRGLDFENRLLMLVLFLRLALPDGICHWCRVIASEWSSAEFIRRASPDHHLILTFQLHAVLCKLAELRMNIMEGSLSLTACFDAISTRMSSTSDLLRCSAILIAEDIGRSLDPAKKQIFEGISVFTAETARYARILNIVGAEVHSSEFSTAEASTELNHPSGSEADPYSPDAEYFDVEDSLSRLELSHALPSSTVQLANQASPLLESEFEVFELTEESKAVLPNSLREVIEILRNKDKFVDWEVILTELPAVVRKNPVDLRFHSVECCGLLLILENVSGVRGFDDLRRRSITELLKQDTEHTVTFICGRLREGSQSLVLADRELILLCLSDFLDHNPASLRDSTSSVAALKDPGWNAVSHFTREFENQSVILKPKAIHSAVLIFWELSIISCQGDDSAILALQLRVLAKCVRASSNQPDITEMVQRCRTMCLTADLLLHPSPQVRSGTYILLFAALKADRNPFASDANHSPQEMISIFQTSFEHEGDDDTKRAMVLCIGEISRIVRGQNGTGK